MKRFYYYVMSLAFMILEDGLKLPTMLIGSLVECGLKPMIILMVLKQVNIQETLLTMKQL